MILQQTLLVGIGMIGGTRHEARRQQYNFGHIISSKGLDPYLIGKSFFYLLVSVFNIIFALIVVHHLFNFPDNTSVLSMAPLLLAYLLAVIFPGLACAQFFKHREHGIMLLVFLSPLVLFLSGVSWPPEAMPVVLYKLSYVYPSTSMLPAYLRMRTMGANILEVKPEFITLWTQAAVYYLLALWVTRRNLSKDNNLHIVRGRPLSSKA